MHYEIQALNIWCKAFLNVMLYDQHQLKPGIERGEYPYLVVERKKLYEYKWIVYEHVIELSS